MLKRVSMMVGMGLFVITGLYGCAKLSHAQSAHLPPVSKLPPVQQVSVSAPINLTIQAGTPHNQLKLFGNQAVVDATDLSISHTKFSLDTSHPSLGATIDISRLSALSLKDVQTVRLRSLRPVHLNMYLENVGHVILSGRITIDSLIVTGKRNTDISTAKHSRVRLEALTHESASQLTISQVSSDGLAIQDTGGGNTILQGVLNVVSIHKDEEGLLEIQWVKSNQLQVDVSGRAIVRLAGTAGRMSANVKDKAQLQARFLRGDLVHVFTFDQGVADVTALKQLFVIAKDYSLVKYYHTTPIFYGRYFDQGVILNLS